MKAKFTNEVCQLYATPQGYDHKKPVVRKVQGGQEVASITLSGYKVGSEMSPMQWAIFLAAAPEVYEALEDALPALWLAATSGHPDAIRIHNKARDALALAHSKTTPGKAV